jgi:acetyl-CoA carboxylase biotin carboxylase subunit
MFHKLLIANRGEVACRIMRTARRLGLRTIAVYSDADAHAAHVAMADEALRIGPAPARASYLDIAAVLASAKTCGADAVHPGYGFLSENAEFAEACAAAGIIFVGPPPASIRAMGLKDRAKALMKAAGVPVVPGYHSDDQADAALQAASARLGYPLLIKAAAGGGGKGMRRVERAADFDDALAGARREAQAAFGDSSVLIEKYVATPRHIEVQVFADAHGHVLHLLERDCSLQRRHQKVIEEAPAPGLSEALRAHIGAVAVKAAKAVNYVGAGTVEFIADASEGLRADRIWFMEMNTRLQVEHPVTEAITGLDLVEWQLRVAADEALPWLQDDLRPRGHAIEARLYAEDPEHGFLPSTGTLEHLLWPDEVRVDSGVRQGDAMTEFYDPMLAKLIAHAPTRTEAAAKLADALGKAQIAGLKTNNAFLRRALQHPDFLAGRIDTGFIARHLAELAAPSPIDDDVLEAAAALLHATAEDDGCDPWSRADGFRLAGAAKFRADFIAGGKRHSVAIAGAPRQAATALRLFNGDIAVMREGETFVLHPYNPLAHVEEEGAIAERITAPMPGRIVQVHIKAGQAVGRGEPLMVLEAMKMEHTLSAPADATVETVEAAVGDQIVEGAVLVRFAEKT